MATDDQNNYWAESPLEQPTDQNQPVTDTERQGGVEEATAINDTSDDRPITWSAQEYIHLDRNPIWFIIFAVVVIALVAVDIFLLKSWTFSALVVVMAVAIIVYIRRPPRTLTYALSPKQGLYVGEHLYGFEEFRAFGLIDDSGNHSVMLIPRKRFAPGVSVFFPQEAGERIVDILGQQLPMENLKLDIVDIVVRKLRL